MAHVSEKAGRYYLVFERPRPDGSRGQHWRVTPASSREEAGALLEVELAAQVESTVAGYLGAWLERRAANLRPSTYQSYRRVVRTHVNAHIGDVSLQILQGRHIEELYRTLRAEGLAARTVRYVHAVLGKALHDAVRRGLLAVSPMGAVEPPRVERSEMTCWTSEESRAFLEQARGDQLYELWLLMLATGMRRGEALGLQWRDVNLGTGLLSVQRAVTWTGKETVVTPPKTSRGRRPVWLDPATVAALRALQVRTGGIGAAWVFSRPDGGFLSPGRVSQQFRALVDSTDLPRIRLHDLRHTHATAGLAAGIDARILEERLGHSPGYTAQAYQHVSAGLQQQAAATMGELLFGAP